eukprot:TRINITY_DN28007_c0_g1_i1.p1 TRINITY_DN28007_c0_g1~~TRINITY_DN28007_c0_g1_i1.p1  ORF type:complete len:485 (+),score=60.42 TRINITY_DN28007_c0_g1_i1:139-1593(+)
MRVVGAFQGFRVWLTAKPYSKKTAFFHSLLPRQRTSLVQGPELIETGCDVDNDQDDDGSCLVPANEPPTMRAMHVEIDVDKESALLPGSPAACKPDKEEIVLSPAASLPSTVATDMSALNGKKIEIATDDEFRSRYDIGRLVQASTNPGMTVRYATRREDDVKCVLKTRDKAKSFLSVACEQQWRRSMEFQLNLPCTNGLCELHEVLETPLMYHVIMEKVPGKDIHDQLAAGRKISLDDAREIMWQLLTGLDALHSRGVIHKDLKLENVVVDLDNTFPLQESRGQEAVASPTAMQSPSGRPGQGLTINTFFDTRTSARCMSSTTSMSSGSLDSFRESPSPSASPKSVTSKIIDFDTIEEWNPKPTQCVIGSDRYIAPEGYEGVVTPASDIYAAGVIMYKLLTNRFPLPRHFFDDQPGENIVGHPAMQRIARRIRRARVHWNLPPFDRCPEALDLCVAMLATDASRRPTVQAALQHKWFQDATMP